MQCINWHMILTRRKKIRILHRVIYCFEGMERWAQDVRMVVIIIIIYKQE